MSTAPQTKKLLTYEVEVSSEKCRGCGKCVETCPKNCHILEEHLQKARLIADYVCTGCQKCKKACAYNAIAITPIMSAEWRILGVSIH